MYLQEIKWINSSLGGLYWREAWIGLTLKCRYEIFYGSSLYT